MRILGIYDDHNCGCAIIEDGKILAAVEEERLSRIKLHNGNEKDQGPPYRSLEAVLRLTHSSPDNVERIAIAIAPPAQLMKQVLRDLVDEKNFRWWLSSFITRSPRWDNYWLFYPYFYNWYRLVRTKRLLRKYGLGDKPIDLVDHHTAHAASAFYTRGVNEAMVFTLDGQGDGLCGSVFKGKGNRLRKIAVVPSYHSLGLFYNLITWALGFKPNRHEGKITGLAAYGNYERVRPLYDQLFTFNGVGEFQYTLAEKAWWHHPYPHRTNYPRFLEPIREQLSRYSREDIAAGVQHVSEVYTTRWVSRYLKDMGAVDLCLAGGVFANVRINQEVSELENVRSVFIFPAMGDGGLCVGAALYSYYQQQPVDDQCVPCRLEHVYLGPSYTDEEIVAELKKHNLYYEYCRNIEERIGELLAAGKVVARFNGPMEYGPRALGNRSILYQPTDPTVNDWLNKKLRRTEFMPFAPSTLREDLGREYKMIGDNEMPALYMTITFDCTEEMHRHCPAVVHVDGTARPQLVDEAINPSYYRILQAYKRLTGLSSFINTSFNMHEEPIVCSPYDAIRAFKLGHLDYLAAGHFLVPSERERTGTSQR